jgi:hypothetical protein
MSTMDSLQPKNPGEGRPWISRFQRDRLIYEDFSRGMPPIELSFKYTLSKARINNIIHAKTIQYRRLGKYSNYGSVSRDMFVADMFVAEFGRAPEVLYHLLPHIKAIRSIAEGEKP